MVSFPPMQITTVVLLYKTIKKRYIVGAVQSLGACATALPNMTVVKVATANKYSNKPE